MLQLNKNMTTLGKILFLLHTYLHYTKDVINVNCKTF